MRVPSAGGVLVDLRDGEVHELAYCEEDFRADVLCGTEVWRFPLSDP